MIGVCEVHIHMPNTSSLKSKRKIIKSLKDRIRSKFNVTVAEMGNQDKWQRAVIQIGYINNNRARIDQIMQHIISLINTVPDAIIIDYNTQIL